MKKNSNKKLIYVESERMLNPPKGYKKSVKNQPDPEKVKAYYRNKR